LLTALFAAAAYGGITGTISGVVKDKDTGSVLPGAQIVVEGTTAGSMADKNGYFFIQNLPAGTYDVKVLMIGYAEFMYRQVQVNVDITTTLNPRLSTKVLTMEEVTVTNKRELIQSEMTSSSYFVSGKEISDDLPVDSFQEAASLLPGMVGNHFRGGRETDVIYMVDGLPIQGALSREISSYFPNSSIVEMMVQTGGFSAEYGHASSGIVNVVTKDGYNEVKSEVRVFSDFVDTGLTGSDNTRRLDINVGGPMTLGFGGPLIDAQYFISADLNLSDTPYKEQMRDAFDWPIFSNVNLNSKLRFEIGNNTRLSLQGLLSNWKWRQFDSRWQENLEGLAKHSHNSHRLSASLTHAFSSKFYASLAVAHYAYKRSVLGADETQDPEIEFQDENDASSLILSGTEPWNEETREKVRQAKFDLVGQVHPYHLLKAGIDFQHYNLNSQSIRFDPISRLGQVGGIAFNETNYDYQYSPRFVAVYLQDQIDYKGIAANIGVRYDLFAPNIAIDESPANDVRQFRSLFDVPTVGTRSEKYAPLSPRLGVSLPLSETERLHLNYGWYYQMPSLYYVYSNAERELDGYLPFAGNLELEPIKTISSEFSYKKIVNDDLLFVFTGFTKQFSNLIDTRTFILPDSLITTATQTVGFAEYTNSATGRASGFEMTFQKRLTDQLSGRLSYTYMKANGTSSTAEDDYQLAITGAPNQEKTEVPLSWDQRHSMILGVDYDTNLLQINAIYRLFSPLPFTTPGSAIPNNARQSWRNILDLRIKFKSYSALGGQLVPFVDIRNVFDEENVVNVQDETGIRAYRLFDPMSTNFGRRLRVGMKLDL
jgi:outer membrane receptor for ferrienterochelin and colicin